MQTTYGKRRRINDVELGVRTIAPTFGRVQLQTHSPKAGHIVVDGQAERLVSHVLQMDPSVTFFAPQPFSLDLNEQRILRTKEQLTEARRKQATRKGPCLYTPDFCVTWSSHRKTVLEVKAKGFEGDAHYAAKLQMAKVILERHGYEFAVLVIPSSYDSPLAFNLQLLRQSRLHRTCLLENISSLLNDLHAAELTLGQACEALQCTMRYAPILVASGVLSMDIAHHAMHANTPVMRAYGELSHLSIVGGLMQ